MLFYTIQAQPFLPDDASEWVGFITATVIFGITIVGMIIRIGRNKQKQETSVTLLEASLTREINTLRAAREAAVSALHAEVDRRFKEQGERIGRQEGACSGQSEAIAECRRLQGISNIEIQTNVRELGELRGAGTEIKEGIALQTESLTLIRERIARLEERTQGRS